VTSAQLKHIALCATAFALTACVTKTQQIGNEVTSSASSKQSDARNRARIHTELGALYFQRGQDGVAIQELKEAINASDEYLPAFNMLALVYMDLKENDLARENFERALRLAPTDSEINNNFGWFLCQTGKQPESIQYFLNAIKNPLYDTPQKAYLNAGLCSLKDNVAQADDYFQRALKLDPNLPQALISLGQLRYRQGRFNEARALVLRFNKIGEPTAESLWLAIRVERQMGDKGAEASFVAQLRRNFSGSDEYQNFLKGNF
jgi:type IV pilus assembly protein PilF